MFTTLNDFSPIEHLVGHVLNDVMRTPLGGSIAPRNFAPPADIRTSETEVCLCWDVPGLKQDDLDLSIENGVLTVKGERRYEGNGNEGAWLGRRYGTFTAAYRLPDYADTENVAARLADGVLTVRIPKHERARARKVAISIGGSDDPKQLNKSNH